MKSWLLTIILAILCVFLGFGWVVDHTVASLRVRKLREQYRQSIAFHWESSCVYADARRLILDSRRFKKRDVERPFSFEANLVDVMSDLCRYERDIDLSLESQGELSVTLGHDILEILDCKTVESYFALATKNFSSEDDVKIFPDFHDRNSKEYRLLRDFVGRSILTEHKTDWKW